MSGRLKRKLGELGVDTSSSKANESFCLIGTPLPPLEKSKDTGEFVPLWKQEVRDEKGRRRLHGAFTGGFSAGYFNTVGSKEGWAPSTFVSSRSDRAKKNAARPEDFMDEEDLADIRESRNLVDTTEQMDLLGGTQAEVNQRQGLDDAEKDPLTLALESAMLPPPSDSAGARILKRMGWRPGQGIGPRVTDKQRKRQDLELGIITDDQPDDEEASKHMYAPRDTGVVVVERRDGTHGLGYRPGLGLNETLGVESSSGSVRRLAAGFGLGALNDADEDDLDVYDRDVDHARSRTAFDAINRDEEVHIVTGPRSARGARDHGPRAPSSRTFKDGRLVLAGFVLSNQPVVDDRWFPIPDIPKGWTPDPRRVWEKYKEKANTTSALPVSQPTTHAIWKTSISADERGTILGETPLPAAPRSVFEYMSQKDRERLQHITANTEKPALTNIPASYSSSSPTIVVPHTDPHVAEAAIHGFQPFATDPEKQARYVAYLQSQASPGSQLLIKPRSGQSVDDFNKELSDYAKSALIFKPMSGAMAGMFTSATIIETGPKVHEGLFIPSAEKIADESKSSDSPPEKLEDTSAKAHAARMGMYGPLTREVTKWLPAKLLCKRFGVKDPDPGPENIADQAPASASSWTPEAALASSVSGTKSDLDKATETASSRRDGPRDLTNIGLGGDENQGRDTLTYERPAMDIFKAIFASDDEDSGDEQDHNALAGPSGELEKAAPLSQPTTSVAATPITREPAAEKTPDRAEKIDMATFKPTFIPRSTKDDKQKESRKKKKKQSSSKAVLVSFEVDEGGEGGDLEGSKKKKRKGRKQNHEDEEGMWVEKPPPEVKTFPKLPIATVEEEFRSSEVVGPPRERKRAIDFM